MYHICYTNPEAWSISIEKGIYGNVGNRTESIQTFWGKTVDLIALKPGDKVFFYIKETQVLTGLYEVISEPFYCEDNLFETVEKYPFRFNFIEIQHFEKSLPVSELAKLIEKGFINSFRTFDRDRNASFRGIRQLTNDEGKILVDSLKRFNPKANIEDVRVYEHEEIHESQQAVNVCNLIMQEGSPSIEEPIGLIYSKIPVTRKRINNYIAQYETSLQGYINFCIRRGLNNVIEDIEVKNFTECLMETPLLKAQQFRSDLLCLYRENNMPHFYSIIEIKRDTEISINHLSQLIGYMKTFSESKGIPFNSIEGVYISNEFEPAAIDYLRNRRSVEKENPIRLIKYNVTEQGIVSFTKIEI